MKKTTTFKYKVLELPAHNDDMRVNVTYQDGKNEHETTIGELKKRFCMEGKQWQENFLTNIIKGDTGYTRVGIYKLIP